MTRLGLVHIVVLICLVWETSCQLSAIKRVDFMFPQFHRLRTSQYYDDYSGVSNVIIRRGEDFKFAVELAQNLNKETISIQMSFLTRKDRMTINLSSNSVNGWRIQQSSERQRILVHMHIPGKAPIGRWSMQITLRDSYGVVIEEYETPNKIIILCNPWSKDDQTYFSEVNKLSEYVMNERGLIYTYYYKYWSSIPWIYGQFQSEILDAILFVLDRSELTAAERGDAVLVSRALTYLMNDDGLYNRGVLQGKWEKPFGPIDGRLSTKPWEWIGSPPILKSYYWSGGKTVGYGQCWVYAGILTTALRALGIPARPVSNFQSAHDQGVDLTLDIYLDADGFKNKSSDVLWNFHVWTQAWTSRSHDLGSQFSGWQNLDATPQALNDNKYQVGPASSAAIRASHLRSRFESAYFYSTINADYVTYYPNKAIKSIQRDKVGLAVMTKAVGSNSIENLIYSFKPAENTTAERESYRKAAQVLGLKPVSLIHTHVGRSSKKHLLLAIKVSENVKIGSPIVVEVLVRNPSSRSKSVRFGVKATSLYYNGRESGVIKFSTYKFVLKGLATHKLKFVISPDDYIEKISDSYTIRLEAVGKIDHTKGLEYASKRISMHIPILRLTAPKEVKVNQTFPFTIQLTNPFNRKLTGCHVILEGTRLERKVIPVPDIPPNAVGGTTVKLRSKYPLLETIAATFTAKNLRDIYGSIDLKVIGKRRYTFGVYSLNTGKLQQRQGGLQIKGFGQMQKIISQDFKCCNIVEFSEVPELRIVSNSPKPFSNNNDLNLRRF